MFVFKRAHVMRVQKKNSASAEAVLQKLNNFLNEASPKLAQLLYRLYQNQQDAISYKELREAMLNGYEAEIQQWQEEYATFINETIYPALIEAIKAGAKQMEDKLGIKYFDDSDRDVKAWLQGHGAEFITNETDEIRSAVKAIVFKGQSEGWAAATMARYIRPAIGLTRPDAIANANYQQKVYDMLRENHPRMKEKSAAKKAQEAALKYAAKQHRRRADMIANTELAFAYNRGTHESVRQAMRDGLMGPCEKVWTTAGSERVCSRCAALNGQVVGFEESFAITGKELFRGMHQTPPAHPRCRCVIQYREIMSAKAQGVNNLTNTNFIQSIKASGYTKDQRDALQDLYEKTPADIKSLYVKFGQQLQEPAEDITKAATVRAYFDSSDNRVHLICSESANGNSCHMPFGTHFHEYAHNLDWLAGTAKGYNAYFSATYKINNWQTFKDIIQEDWDATVKKFYNHSKLGYQKAFDLQTQNAIISPRFYLKDLIDKWQYTKQIDASSTLYQNTTAQFSNLKSINDFKQFYLDSFDKFSDIVYAENIETRRDVIEGFCDFMKKAYPMQALNAVSDMFQKYAIDATNDRSFAYPFGVGHEKSYFDKQGNLALEAFAEITESIVTSPGALKLIEAFLPNAYQTYYLILKEMVK